MARSKDGKTPLCIFSFTQDLFTPREKTSDKGVTIKQYGATLLFDKSTDLKALAELVKEAAVAEWGDKAVQWLKDGVIKNPFLDGDGPQAISKKTGERHAGYAGKTFIRVQSGEEFKPGIFNQKVLPITNKDDFYSGVQGFAVVNAYTWENTKNGKGVSFGISMAQKVKDGDRIGGSSGPSPEDYLEAIADEGEAPAETKSGAGAGALFS